MVGIVLCTVDPKICSVESFRVLLGVDCDAAIAIANIIGILIFVVIMIVSLIVVKKRCAERSIKQIS